MIIRKSPAKINLYLEVLGKRRDGYHEIASLMQEISLCDEMVFLPGGRDIRLNCPGGILPEDGRNLVFKAASLLFSHVGASPGIEIEIRKNIPLAAGLGGGSSNAATALKALNEIFDFGLGPEDLAKIGVKTGADVPFFILGKAAWALGIGEKLLPAEDVPPMWLVLVNPGFEVSTREVYQGLNLGLTKDIIQFSIPRFLTLQDLAGGLRNDLERVTLRNHPELLDIKKSLVRHGALGALMSGSGPTVFGVFAEKEQAEAAGIAMRSEGASVWTVRST
ncbi:MAG TPA: 4-(cytidine 5'-diphospho)-2-C-methyl-D-erythritol kinase [Syntrophales bacterium]|nr:4-(cytidine 5'-diphospho)-2-C-methyl-D-erythritol kinase [Syntrophales bacterium]HPL62663.1 4-(cytidine 5'-diphospho)-2-C-methyl-D-erythritol kinase [Syntrophales bacterium]